MFYLEYKLGYSYWDCIKLPYHILKNRARLLDELAESEKQEIQKAKSQLKHHGRYSR